MLASIDMSFPTKWESHVLHLRYSKLFSNLDAVNCRPSVVGCSFTFLYQDQNFLVISAR